MTDLRTQLGLREEEIMHIPTSWRVVDNHVYDIVPAAGSESLSEIARVWRSTEGKANAHFIVTACNSHQALVDALEAVLRHCVTLGGFPEKGRGRTDEQQAAYDAARAALKEAKGE